MTTTAFRGGTIVDQSGERLADIVVDDVTGSITDIGSDVTADNSIDAEGCVIMPGLVDLHVHLRQPGNEAAETIESGSRAAAVGGYTAVVAMPNTTPCMDSAVVVSEVVAHGKAALCEIKPSAAITVGRHGEALAPMGELVELGVRMFTDDGTGVQDDQLMRRALEYAGSLVVDDGTSIVLSQHCEVTALSQGGVMNEGAWSSRLGLGGQPAEAEELMVMRDIALSRLTGVPVHMQHLSTAGSVALVRAAKAEGHPVTAEATPHHFTLTDAECASYDTVFKVHPPLRTQSDVDAIKQGLVDGTIDAIATDHAPHTPDSKEQPFDQAPPGMVGLESAFALANTELGFPLAQLINVMSTTPARIGGISDRHGGPIEVGRPANLAIADLDHSWTIDRAELAGLSTNTPFHGREVRGKIRHTVYNGEPVVVDGRPTR
ncbi:MAG: dihydroorotase [Acidimicrobiales bacterium]